jgi:hypothetical protein
MDGQFGRSAPRGPSGRRRVASGAWRELHPGVLLAGGHRLTDEARLRAAWLWAGGPTALLCGPTAAFWHGLLARPPLVVEITVPRGHHRRAQRGVQLRRRDLDQRDRARRRGVTLTGRGLTVLERAIALPDGSAFLDRAPSAPAAAPPDVHDPRLWCHTAIPGRLAPHARIMPGIAPLGGMTGALLDR